MKSDWESFHRVYFLSEDSVELNFKYIFIYKENNKKIRMKYMYKRFFRFVLIVKKLEISRVEVETGRRSSHYIIVKNSINHAKSVINSIQMSHLNKLKMAFKYALQIPLSKLYLILVPKFTTAKLNMVFFFFLSEI